MNILFVTARFPYPPLRGDQVIPYHRLKLLSKRHSITLITFYQHDNELVYLKELSHFCADIITVKLCKISSILNLLKGFFSKLPFQVLYFHSKEFKKQLQILLLKRNFNIIHTFTLRMAEYTKNINIPKVIDLIDSMQLNIERRLLVDNFFLKILLREELKRLREYENGIANIYDSSVVVSERDRNYVSSKKVLTIPLGVDVDFFKRHSNLPFNITIIFSGNMGYFPNENAVLWFVDNCFIKIKGKIPNVKLLIVGNNPTAKVKNLHNGDSVIVTSYVDSMVDILNKAQVAIAPMQAGSGMQFKILEAMACELPVVTTKIGIGGISSLADRENIVIADSATDFSNACIELLCNYQLAVKIGKAAREIVVEKYGWELNVSEIEKCYNNILRKPD